MKVSLKNWIAPIALLGGLLVYLLALRGDSPDAETRERFAQAAAHFEKGHFQEAEKIYGKLIDDGKQSAAIYYNLALTQEALEQPGRAIFSLEKATQLDPGSSEVREKLAELRKNNGSQELAQPGFWQSIPPHWLAIAGALALLALALVPLSSLFKFPYFSRAITVIACLSIMKISTRTLKTHDQENQNRAIIVSSKAPLRLSPFDGAKAVLTLAPGQTVKTVEDKTHEDFQLVTTEQGQSGWVQSDELKSILNSTTTTHDH